MKCPICGEELVQSKKDPNYLLCYNCKKKYKVAQKSGGERTQTIQTGQTVQKTQSRQRTQTRQHTQSGQTARSRSAALEDQYDEQYDPYEEEHLSNVPIIALGAAIVVVLGLIVVMLVL